MTIDEINNLDRIAKRIKLRCLCCDKHYYVEVEDKNKAFDGWFIENK